MDTVEHLRSQNVIESITNDLNDKQKSCTIVSTEEMKVAIAIQVIISFSGENILFCAPTEIEVRKIQDNLEVMGCDLMRDFKNLQFYTYDQLYSMIKNVKKPGYSLLICDEVQILNQKKQYQSIKQLFADNKNKKYFGLSKTPLSQWEYDKIYQSRIKSGTKLEHIIKSLYENNISFFYSIEDALIDGVSSVPVYNEYFVLENKKPRTIAFELLRQVRVRHITEEGIEAIESYLIQEASLVNILEKYIEPKNSRIIYICKDLQDLSEKEQLLKERFPQLSVYKTSSTEKRENEKNLHHFLNAEFIEENSKVLLSLKPEIEGISIDGKTQLIFGTKTNSYKDFIRKFTKTFSLGEDKKIEVLDLGGNLDRIRSLDFFEFKYNLERRARKQKKDYREIPQIEYSGNMPNLNTIVNKIARDTFVSKKEKTTTYYNKMILNFGVLKNPEETFRDDTSLKDWEIEMNRIATTELHLLEEDPGHRVSEEDMYIIETLAYIDYFFQIPITENEKSKREAYYKKAILCKDFLIKNEFLRFSDGTYMSTWYQSQKRKVEAILNRMEKKDSTITEEEAELLQWMNQLHIDLKVLWIERILRVQKKEQQSELYQEWKRVSNLVAEQPNLLKSKKDWDSLEKFWQIEEIYNETENRTYAIADKNFPYADYSNMKEEYRNKLVKKCK